MNLKPIRDVVIIEENKSEVISAGGIHFPASMKVLMRRGTVLAAGPGEYQDGILIPMSVKAGDRVIYNEGSGIKFSQDGKELTIMPELAIVAVEELT